MRTCVQIYRLLARYLDDVDAESLAAGTGPQHPDVDNDFRSGVLLGMGVTHLLLSLLPSRIGTVMEIFGYKGNRREGLEILAKAGGWSPDLSVVNPGINANDEGVRRPIADMALLIFHLVLSSFTFDGVDMRYANKILAWNLKRFPSGMHLNPSIQRSCCVEHFLRCVLLVR
jgi:tetratricopeptide repeat protein 39